MTVVILESCWPAVTVHLLNKLANCPCFQFFILHDLTRCGFECSVASLHTNSRHRMFLKFFQSFSVPLFMRGWMALVWGGHAIGLVTINNIPVVLGKKLGCKSVLQAWTSSQKRSRRTGHRAEASCFTKLSICHQRQASHLLPLIELGKFILRSARSFTLTAGRLFPKLPFPD